ncbi:MAG: sigma-70 family RNA polymerase sigma factor [Cyanobacteria bacterium J055]|nr:MAG: sigma-70 family RNA polymerase sigma factor [Cyanobacteria bacterium J055]
MDENIDRLIAKTCCCPKGSLERRRRLNQLIGEIQRSGKLLRGAGLAHSDYEDALQQTWLYLCRNLCEPTTGQAYDPNRGCVTTWLNAYLKRRIQDRFQKAAERAKKRMPYYRDEPLDPVETIAAPPEPPPILDDIKEWVENESRQLRKIHVRNRPDINCYVLILHRLPPERSWEDLSQQFGVGISTLSNFYQRECFPRLLAFGRSQGYL